MQRAALLLTAMVLSGGAFSAEPEKSIFDLDLESLLKIKVASVSRVKESVRESVVPVTVIDHATIHNSGAQTLKDLLITYVPGMVFVQDQNEVNVSMRGIYSSSQQKMLILLNGHRLNSRVISSANPDFAIGLDKIKQIEIVRGPGSAVFGNVALTAVINIVTKQGKTVQGGEFNIGIGNFGQRFVNANWGKGDSKQDIFGWLHYYQNDGEKIAIAPQNDYARTPDSVAAEAILNGFFDKPAYDLGIQFQYDDWTLLLNSRRAHYVEPFSSANLTGEAYNYNQYEKHNGIGPGAQYQFNHLALSHELTLSPYDKLKSKIYWDSSSIEAPLVQNPSSGLFGMANFYDQDFGIEALMTRQHHWGTALVGIQMEQMRVTDSEFLTGSDGVYTGEAFTEASPLLPKGHENLVSLFSVAKYHLNQNWLFNFGLRYDKKQRRTLGKESNLSPRIGWVFDNHDDFQLKISYGESFVDAPYWNRYGALPSFRGSESLKPERLKSWQITPSWQSSNGTWQYEMNWYYNKVIDFVYRNNLAAADEPINTNAGLLTSWGLEQQFVYQQDNFKLRMLSNYNEVLDFSNFAATGDDVFNIPHLSFNLIADYRWNESVSTNLTSRFIGDRLSPINISLNGQPIPDPYPDSGVNYQVPNNRLPSVTLVDLNLHWKNLFSIPLELQLNINNLLDKQWQQGGTTIHPYQQPGRWWMIKTSYSW